jgi:hypothetical protein
LLLLELSCNDTLKQKQFTFKAAQATRQSGGGGGGVLYLPSNSFVELKINVFFLDLRNETLQAKAIPHSNPAQATH